MSSSLPRRVTLALAALGLATVLPAAPATAADLGGCDLGVTVVVDFTDVGGEVETGCATGDPASGREALERAGFTPTDSVPGKIGRASCRERAQAAGGAGS